jgi:hypothetical protein
MRGKAGVGSVSDGRATIRTIQGNHAGNEDSLKNEDHDDASQRTTRGRPIHHSPLFWIGVVLCLAALVIYVMSYDLSWPVAK